MSRDKENARIALEKDLNSRRMKYFYCSADALYRRLVHFEIVSDVLKLQMDVIRPEDAGHNRAYSWAVDQAEKRFTENFEQVSQQKAQGHTNHVPASLGQPTPTPATVTNLSVQESVTHQAEVIPISELPAAMQQIKQQVEGLLPMQKMAEGLDAIFSKLVESTKPGARPNLDLINTAKAAEGLVGRAIEMRKVQLEGMKLLVDQNRKLS